MSCVEVFVTRSKLNQAIQSLFESWSRWPLKCKNKQLEVEEYAVPNWPLTQASRASEENNRVIKNTFCCRFKMLIANVLTGNTYLLPVSFHDPIQKPKLDLSHEIHKMPYTKMNHDSSIKKWEMEAFDAHTSILWLVSLWSVVRFGIDPFHLSDLRSIKSVWYGLFHCWHGSCSQGGSGV